MGLVAMRFNTQDNDKRRPFTSLGSDLNAIFARVCSCKNTLGFQAKDDVRYSRPLSARSLAAFRGARDKSMQEDSSLDSRNSGLNKQLFHGSLVSVRVFPNAVPQRCRDKSRSSFRMGGSKVVTFGCI